MKKRGTRNAERGILTLLLASLLPAGCSRETKPLEAAQAPVAVRTIQMERAPIDEIYEATGTVRARNTAVIASKVPGYIQQIRVNAGDRVAAGQVLVVLAAQDLDAQVARAQAAAAAAASGVAEAEKSRLAAQAAAQLTATTHRRYQDLLAKRAVSQQEFDEAEARYRSAAATQEMSSASVERARSSQQQAEAELRATRVTRGYAGITAPFAGIVTEKRMDAGSLAMPGQPLLVIEQSSGFRFEAAVEERLAGTVRPGTPARVVIEATGFAGDGRVSEVVPSVDPGSRSFIAKIDVPLASGLRSGLFGRASFVTGRREAISIPTAAVVTNGQLQSVYVADGKVARQRLVSLGTRGGDRVEVLSGLAPGERLIISDPARLRDGVPIEVQP